MSAISAACGCADVSNTRDHHPATTTSSEIRLSDAEPLGDLQAEDVQVTMTDKLSSPEAAQTTYFGEADAYDSNDTTNAIASVPIIALHQDDVWKVVALDGPGLGNAGWKYVGSGPARHEVWGVLDTSTGDSQPDFVLAHSIDGAMSFSIKVFHKPCRLAQVDDFSMSRTGHGLLTLSLDTDCGPNKTGLYIYETDDHGKSWSKPRCEPDAMIHADSVSDEEQPQPSDNPTYTVSAERLTNHRALVNHKTTDKN